jgi:RNA polymerase sigma-70 factor (ECF subfamily)
VLAGRGRRDEASFDDAFRDLFRIAHRVATRILANRTAAEDVAAETMSRAYAHWSRIGEASYRDAWIARVAANLALNTARRRPHLVRSGVQLSHDEAVAARVALIDALRSLSSRQREVIVLRHLAGLSEPEVAAHLGLGLGTVKTHLRRGQETLRLRFGADLDAPVPDA